MQTIDGTIVVMLLCPVAKAIACDETDDAMRGRYSPTMHKLEKKTISFCKVQQAMMMLLHCRCNLPISISKEQHTYSIIVLQYISSISIVNLLHYTSHTKYTQNDIFDIIGSLSELIGT